MGETADRGWEGQYAWEWIPDGTAPTKKTRNANGVTGWGRLLRSSNPRHGPGEICKVHVCAHNPCKVRWEVTKYGMWGSVTHMQTITNMGPPAPLQAPLLDVQPAPPALSDTAVAGVPIAGATLANHTAVAEAMVGLDAEAAAYTNVCNAMLRLARELRRPRNYVGYFAFLVFGLCKQCQPWAWEGRHHQNLLGHYAPWALESCTRECAVDAVPCALVPKVGGLIECSPISEETPLSRMSHYVAGIKIPPQSRNPEGPITFEDFYGALGVLTVPTVCDGDCGLDVMNMMLGLPQSLETRKALRAEISVYFFGPHA